MLRMKRTAPVVAAATLVLALVGCSDSEMAEDVATSVIDSAVQSQTSEVESTWTDCATAADAAVVAGFDGFSEGAGAITRLGDQYEVQYLATDGVSQAIIEYPASMLFVCKGNAADGTDVSGDDTAYAFTWNTTVGDVELTCSGNREGDAQKTIWTVGDYAYSITTLGLGGEEDFGINADDLALIVPQIS